MPPGFWHFLLSSLPLLLVAAIIGCAGTPEPPLPFTPGPSTPSPTRESPTATPQPSQDEPVGFPLATTLRPMRVIETAQGRRVAPAAPDGPTVLEVSGDLHTRPENDMESNRYGWNCRLHNKYEGAPGVDWYLPEGTLVTATMRGMAELYLITTVSSFSYYGIDASIMLGLPPPTTPINPFPGPNGGLGVFVSVLNGNLRAEYGHLGLADTLALAPEGAFVAPYSRKFDYKTAFGKPRHFTDYTLIARWSVKRGDVVGKVGNTGYSDVAHLHYQIMDADRKTKYCPTQEEFPGAGWLFQRPQDFPPAQPRRTG